MRMKSEEVAVATGATPVYRCRMSVIFSLKCVWLLKAYNFNKDMSV